MLSRRLSFAYSSNENARSSSSTNRFTARHPLRNAHTPWSLALT